MAKVEFTVRFYFTSQKADGDSYFMDRKIFADNHNSAISSAKFLGWQEFGARFNDNCFDWQIVSSSPK